VRFLFSSLLFAHFSYRLPSTVARRFTTAILPAARGRAPVLATETSVDLWPSNAFDGCNVSPPQALELVPPLLTPSSHELLYFMRILYPA
jgi:hypothetical protein